MAMRIGDRHKLSPNSAGAMFSSPHRCRRPPPLLNTDKELCRIRPRTMQADATKSACSIPAISSAQHVSIPFVFFDFFDFFNLPTAVAHSLPSIHLNLCRSPVAASHVPSNPPEPLFTSGCRHRRCRRIPGVFRMHQYLSYVAATHGRLNE